MKCVRCHQKLREIPWSRDKTMLVCNNGACEFYRRPVSTHLPAEDQNHGIYFWANQALYGAEGIHRTPRRGKE